MPKTKARSGAFQKGADVWSNKRQGHVALHHFETTHYYECIGHYKKKTYIYSSSNLAIVTLSIS